MTATVIEGGSRSSGFQEEVTALKGSQYLQMAVATCYRVLPLLP
jgi:hypothetical protein